MKIKKIGPGGRPKFYYVDPPLYLSDYLKKMNNDGIILIDEILSFYTYIRWSHNKSLEKFP